MLTIYRRHKSTCKAEEYDRTYRRCQCPIHVEGTLGGRMIRESLKTSNWALASDRIREAEARGTWDATNRSTTPTIEDCVTKFLADVRTRLTAPTVKKYEVLLDRQRMAGRFDPDKHSPTLMEYSTQRGLVRIDDLTVDAVREFRNRWKDGALAGTKKLERLRSFFRFCVDSEWIGKNPASAVKPVKPTAEEACPTLPFEEAEMTRLHAALPQLAKSTMESSRGMARSSDHLERFEVLLQVMECTGLAIGDATKLDKSMVVDGRVFLRRMKTGTPVYVPIPPDLVEALQRLPLLQDRYYFWTGEGRSDVAAGNYRRTFRKLCALAKVQGGHPHRLRDTFSVRLLKNGVPLERVSKLLGHKSVKITEAHYAPWVQALQEQLEADVRKTWAKRPKAKPPLAVITGGKRRRAQT